MMHALRVMVVLLGLGGGLLLGAGCAERQPQFIDSDTSIERPARPVSEEEGLSDRIGEVGVVLLVVAIAVGVILIPILLL